MFAIARYTVINYFRNNNITYEIPETAMVFDEQQLEHTKEDCLIGIIKSLPKKYRDPLFLFDIKGIKQIQISKQLHLPLCTIKSQIQRGRKLIAQGYIYCCDFRVNDAGYLVGEIKDKEVCKICH